jgi:hypothetical protein
MKVFIRTSDIANEKPILIASYPDESDIKDNAHGEGMIVLTVPREVIQSPTHGAAGNGMPYLAKDWRERAGTVPVAAEAKRRIEDAFPISDQLRSLHEMIDAMTKYGAQEAAWPPEIRQRKAAFDERWKYVTDVTSKANEHAPAMPRDPSNDKLWPRRPMKKV